jgi:hypothetical protein
LVNSTIRRGSATYDKKLQEGHEARKLTLNVQKIKYLSVAKPDHNSFLKDDTVKHCDPVTYKWGLRLNIAVTILEFREE